MKDVMVAQLYSLRFEFAKDPDDTLRRVKAIGFNQVQLDGMRGHTTEYIASLLKKHNLKVSSMHLKHDRFIDDVEGIIEESKLFDCKEIYCKYIEDPFQNELGYRFTKQALIKACKILEPLGFSVGLHNPEYDFNNTIDDLCVMDFICKEEAGIQIHPEVDTYWMSVAKKNPLQYAQGYKNRILTLHCKDIDLSKDVNDFPANLVECGKGDVDFEGLIRFGIQNGIKSYAIEQDISQKDMFDSMAESFAYLTQLYQKIVGGGVQNES